MAEHLGGVVRAAVVYDSLFPVTMGGGERLYRRLAELLGERDIRTDYVTRSFEQDAETDGFSVVGIWRGEIYDVHGTRTTRGAVGFAAAVFRYFITRRGSYELVFASALPVLTVLATRFALLGSGTRVIADWLEVWPAAKWREYSGPIAGTIAAVLQRMTARLVREHTVDSRFTGERLTAVSSHIQPVVLGLFDLIPIGRPRAAQNPATVVFVGRLIPDKGVLAVPDALAIARRELPELRAVIIGDGPQREALVTAISVAGLSAVIEVLGRVSDEALEQTRAGAAVLVAPSIREGFGLAVAEASSWGVPVVVVAHEDNAAVDLVESGVNGFVVVPDDADALAAGIVEAVRAGPALRRSSAEWAAAARVTRSLSASLDEILGAASPQGTKRTN